MNHNHTFKRTLSALLLIATAGFAVYSNTFQVPFVFDDNSSIVNNRTVRGIGSAIYAFQHDLGFVQNRIVVFLTFALNYQFGGLDVTGYHVVNLVVHMTSSLLVFALLRQTFLTPFFALDGDEFGFTSVNRGTTSGFLAPQWFIPLAGALFFAVHPVQTQAVTYIVQRLSSMAALFYLLALVLYVQARRFMQDAGEGRQRGAKSIIPVIACYIGSVLAAVLAMKSKEIAFTLPLAAVLYEIYFFRGTAKRKLLNVAPLLATLPIIPLTVLGYLDFGIDSQPAAEVHLGQDEQLKVGTSMSRLDYLFTQFRVIVTYLRIILLPVNQNLDYDYPLFTTFFTPSVMLSFLLLLLLAGVAVFLYLLTRQNAASEGRKSDPLLRLVSFGILWFFLTLSVESSLIPIKDLVMEHRLYLPLFGAATSLTTIFYLLSGRLSNSVRRPFLFAGGAVLILALGVGAYQRNHVWGDPLRLWQDVVSKSPNKARAVNNLGQALEQNGRRGEAFEAFIKAVKLDPTYYKGYYNLADLYLVSNQPERALPLLQNAIRLNPDFTEAYVSLGASLMRAGKFREVASFLESNLARVADIAEARFYLGTAYAFLGNQFAARRELEVLTRLDSSYAATLAGMMGTRLHGTAPGKQQ